MENVSFASVDGTPARTKAPIVTLVSGLLDCNSTPPHSDRFFENYHSAYFNMFQIIPIYFHNKAYYRIVY
jgi:hypothetical protein